MIKSEERCVRGKNEDIEEITFNVWEIKDSQPRYETTI